MSIFASGPKVPISDGTTHGYEALVTTPTTQAGLNLYIQQHTDADKAAAQASLDQQTQAAQTNLDTQIQAAQDNLATQKAAALSDLQAYHASFLSGNAHVAISDQTPVDGPAAPVVAPKRSSIPGIILIGLVVYYAKRRKWL